MNNAHWQKNRKIVERILVEGDLVLETPASLGNGDVDGLTDMPLLLDPQGYALLTGASLAGALRSYLRERECGYGGKAEAASYTNLFGWVHQKKGGWLSPLITSDALSQNKPTIELRDGVKLNPQTRTAEDKKKFDLELLDASTIFPLRLELLVIQEQEDNLRRGLALALQGLERGEIAIGGRKRRGLGRCQVKEWRVRRYDMGQPAGLIGWLEKSGEWQTGTDITSLLGVDSDMLVDQRHRFILQATFALETSLLIRSGSGEADSPDMVHLHSRRNDEAVPILSGTSLTGAIRARAARIAKTIGLSDTFVPGMFGSMMAGETNTPWASRVIVAESEIHNGLTDRVQHRVKLDRFTGGPYPTALFNQQPVFGRTDPANRTCVTINLSLLSNPNQTNTSFEAEIGLLLLLLKDLWTGDLPLGGEISVGRGRLQGLSATLKLGEEEWQLGRDPLVEKGNKDKLESFVQALQEVKG